MTLTTTATTTGHRNSGLSSAPAAFAARSGSSVPRARSASSGLAFGAAAGAPLGGDDAQGQQLGGDEIADLVGGQGPAQVGAGQVGDGSRAPGAVDPAGHPVQQRGHLDDLAVGPPHQRRRLAVAGAFVLAEQLHPVGQPGHPAGPGASAGGRTGAVLPVITCPATAVTAAPPSDMPGTSGRPARLRPRAEPPRRREGRPREPGRPSLSCRASPSRQCTGQQCEPGRCYRLRMLTSCLRR